MKIIDELSYKGNVDGLLDYLQNTEDDLAEVYSDCNFCGRIKLECNCEDDYE